MWNIVKPVKPCKTQSSSKWVLKCLECDGIRCSHLQPMICQKPVPFAWDSSLEDSSAIAGGDPEHVLHFEYLWINNFCAPSARLMSRCPPKREHTPLKPDCFVGSHLLSNSFKEVRNALVMPRGSENVQARQCSKCLPYPTVQHLFPQSIT